MRRTSIALFSAALMLLVSGLTATEIVGRPAHLAHVLTIFFGGVGGGASLMRAVVDWKAARRAAAPAAAAGGSIHGA
jgi:Na+/phosphate symporter